MGRRKITIDTDELRQLMRRGATTPEIAAHFGVSMGTAHARMKEAKGMRRAAAPAAPEAVPDEVPDDASLAQVNKWIAKVEAAAQGAEDDEDYRSFAALTAKLVTLLEHRRKVTPPPAVDPNANPDMVKLAEDVRARLHRMIDAVAEGSR